MLLGSDADVEEVRGPRDSPNNFSQRVRARPWAWWVWRSWVDGKEGSDGEAAEGTG